MKHLRLELCSDLSSTAKIRLFFFNMYLEDVRTQVIHKISCKCHYFMCVLKQAYQFGL